MFNKVAYTAWKWQIMSNKYDVWRFISRNLLAYYDRTKIFLRMQLHILWWAWSHAERKHRSLWPTFYVDTTTNQNIPPTNWSLDPKLRSLCVHLPNARLSLPTGVSVVAAVLCRPWRSACAAVVQSSRCWIWRRFGVSLLTGECRVVLNEDVLAVMYVQMMRDTGMQGLAPDTLDDKYVVVCLSWTITCLLIFPDELSTSKSWRLWH